MTTEAGRPLTLPAVVRRLRAAGCVFAEDEARVLMSATRTAAQLARMVDERVAGAPLEHVVGWAEFCGLRIAVDQGVFVPRHRSELLVTEAVALGRPGAVVIDICCGSGAIGAAVAARLAGVDLHSTDMDPAAVRCARRNVATAGGHVYEGDLYDPLPPTLQDRADLVIANAPYVPAGEIAMLPREARLYEARHALDGGADGLDVVRRIASGAPPWLAPGGHLLVETSRQQAPAAADIFVRAGLVARVARSDELEATAVVGTRGARGEPPPARASNTPTPRYSR